MKFKKNNICIWIDPNFLEYSDNYKKYKDTLVTILEYYTTDSMGINHYDIITFDNQKWSASGDTLKLYISPLKKFLKEKSKENKSQ